MVTSLSAVLLTASFMLPTMQAEPTAPPSDSRDLARILSSRSPLLAEQLRQLDEQRIQILLGEIVDDAGTGRPTLRRSSLGDLDRYFYPASSIKLAAAIAALLELQDIQREHHLHIGQGAAMRIGPRFEGDVEHSLDPSNLTGGTITIEHEIRKLFLVSDNVAFNRLYEFVGHRGLDRHMQRGGFASCRILHRLSEFHPVERQRQTRPVALQIGGGPDATWFDIPARDSDLEFDNADLRDIRAGRAYYQDGALVEQPFSFRFKNAISLRDLQDMLCAIVRPEVDTGKRGFPELSIPARRTLLDALGTYTTESQNPRYDPTEHPDSRTKFVLPGLLRVVPRAELRIYDKIGRAYGFSVENAYVEHVPTGRGFLLSAVIYTNPNATLNDDDYDYEASADPFFAELGEAIAATLWGERRVDPARRLGK